MILADVHLCPEKDDAAMPKNNTATVTRNAGSGRFTVRKEGGSVSTHSSGKKTPETVSSSISKNRDALKRLANR